MINDDKDNLSSNKQEEKNDKFNTNNSKTKDAPNAEDASKEDARESSFGDRSYAAPDFIKDDDDE